MNRDHRKISRSYEERNILASTTRVSQISQADNELKQKLQAINTSHKLSNKRIKNETRELKEILHGLQRELKVSKGNYGQYVPSLIEQPQRKPRRTTVSSVPSEDRKEIALERVSHGRNAERFLEDDATSRRRSGSYPPALHVHDVKKTKDGSDEQLAQNKPDKVLDKTGGKVKDVEQSKSSQQIGEVNARLQNRTEFPDIEQEKSPQRRISRAENEQKRLAERSPKELQQQGERKRSTSDAFRGRFVINPDTNYSETTLSSSMRRTSQTQQKGESGRAKLRPSVVEEFSSVPSPKEQRKTSLGMPQYPWQRKGSVGDRRGSPMTGSPGRYDLHDAEVVFDALPDYLGGRRLSVAHGRARKISRSTGLPPLREEGVTQKSQQERSAENWSDLSQCRYLRKDEQEITIDDIFSKE
ncbi:uncharacterized protein LOC144637919 [Oculina patagonica]